MGQAFRRASGRIRTSVPDPPTSSQVKNVPVVSRNRVDPSESLSSHDTVSDSTSRINPDNVLEDKDQNYDAMLSQMVGRIKSKPGGKLETGEAFVVEKYKRPMPKLRNTTAESGRYEEKPAPAGTLNVAQLRHIFLLHQGKADDHRGPMQIPQIASKFNIDIAHVQRILQFIKLPPEDTTKQEKNQR